MSPITDTTAQKSRDAIVRAIRQLAPIEDASAHSMFTLNRKVCPALRNDTWAEIVSALPARWTINCITRDEFVVSVHGRRAV